MHRASWINNFPSSVGIPYHYTSCSFYYPTRFPFNAPFPLPLSLPLPLSFSFSLSYSRFSRPLQNQTTNEIKLKSLVNEAWSSVVVSRQPCSTPFEGEKERGIGLLSFRIAYVLLVRLKCTFYAGWSREDGHEKKFSTGSSWNCIPGSLFA